jgi:hypothetical protein
VHGVFSSRAMTARRAGVPDALREAEPLPELLSRLRDERRGYEVELWLSQILKGRWHHRPTLPERLVCRSRRDTRRSYPIGKRACLRPSAAAIVQELIMPTFRAPNQLRSIMRCARSVE